MEEKDGRDGRDEKDGLDEVDGAEEGWCLRTAQWSWSREEVNKRHGH